MSDLTNSPSLPAPLTIQRVAEALGVHKSTVSLALAGKGRVAPATRARVLAYVAELGYEPDVRAQGLASRAESNVVCLCSGALDPGRATEKIALIQDALTDAGLEVPIYTPSKKSSGGGADAQVALFRQVRRQRPRAIICSAHAMQDIAFRELELYQRDGGIVISYDVPIPIACDQVVYDREDNAYQGAKYLLERGHRRIGIGMSRIPSVMAGVKSVPQTLRLQGFRRAMQEFGLPVRDEWLFENTTFEKGGSEMARHFLELPERPTGLCVVNDYVALAFMVEIIRAGVRVPQDVSIVGHDDQPIAAFCPVPLTSISQPAEEIVQAVVAMTLERISGSQVAPRTLTIHSKLVERQSVAILPKARSRPTAKISAQS